MSSRPTGKRQSGVVVHGGLVVFLFIFKGEHDRVNESKRGINLRRKRESEREFLSSIQMLLILPGLTTKQFKCIVGVVSCHSLEDSDDHTYFLYMEHGWVHKLKVKRKTEIVSSLNLSNIDWIANEQASGVVFVFVLL